MAKKKTPQDATMRNVHAAHARLDDLERRFKKLAKKVKKLKHS